MKNFKELDKRKVSEVEESILKSWGSVNAMHDEQIKMHENDDTFVFYDGPAFANPLPVKRYTKLISLNSLLNQGIIG